MTIRDRAEYRAVRRSLLRELRTARRAKAHRRFLLPLLKEAVDLRRYYRPTAL